MNTSPFPRAEKCIDFGEKRIYIKIAKINVNIMHHVKASRITELRQTDSTSFTNLHVEP